MPLYRLDALRRSFWFLPAAAMAAGLVAGFGLVELDYALDLDPGVFTFVDLQSARAVLETIATVTVSVAGLAFSVTVVALQLASQQLSPRVLRTFQGDRLAQAVLAAFVGTFVYSLIVLAKLTERGVPALSVTIAIVLAVAAFALFVAFVHHIVISLKASTIIRRIAEDGVRAIDGRWPGGAAGPPADARPARLHVVERLGEACFTVRASGAGFVTAVDGADLVELAARDDLLVRQCVPIGHFVLTGAALAEVSGGAPAEGAGERVRRAFTLGDERSAVADVGFPIRQLVDIALRALSPSLNDPTTAENAVDVITDLLLRFVRAPEPELIRVDDAGTPRLVARAPDLEDMAYLAFEQLATAAAGQPVFARHLAGRIDELGDAARQEGESEAALHALRGMVAGAR
jgi:uncharacterized membrane protein